MRNLQLRFLYRGLRARLRDERAEIAALTGAIRPGDVAVDVGAHKGSFLPSLSWAAGPGKVVAFEPQPVLAEYLFRACRAARLTNVVVEASGVSDAAGTLTLNVPGANAASPGASFEPAVAGLTPGRGVAVSVVTLDDYFRGETRRIAALKIDVEGHELAVLRGAADARPSRPLVVVECEVRHVGEEGVRAVLGFFAERGYAGTSSGGAGSSRGGVRPAVHQKATGGRFWDSKDYCNNFVLRKGPG